MIFDFVEMLLSDHIIDMKRLVLVAILLAWTIPGAQAEVTDPATEDIEAQAEADVAKAVDEINARVSGWVYAIAKYKYDAMVKRPADLLKPLEDS